MPVRMTKQIFCIKSYGLNNERGTEILHRVIVTESILQLKIIR